MSRKKKAPVSLYRLPVLRVKNTIAVTGTRSSMNARKAAQEYLCAGEVLGVGIIMGRALVYPVIKEDE